MEVNGKFVEREEEKNRLDLLLQDVEAEHQRKKANDQQKVLDALNTILEHTSITEYILRMALDNILRRALAEGRPQK